MECESAHRPENREKRSQDENESEQRIPLHVTTCRLCFPLLEGKHVLWIRGRGIDDPSPPRDILKGQIEVVEREGEEKEARHPCGHSPLVIAKE